MLLVVVGIVATSVARNLNGVKLDARGCKAGSVSVLLSGHLNEYINLSADIR